MAFELGQNLRRQTWLDRKLTIQRLLCPVMHSVRDKSWRGRVRWQCNAPPPPPPIMWRPHQIHLLPNTAHTHPVTVNHPIKLHPHCHVSNLDGLLGTHVGLHSGCYTRWFMPQPVPRCRAVGMSYLQLTAISGVISAPDGVETRTESRRAGAAEKPDSFTVVYYHE